MKKLMTAVAAGVTLTATAVWLSPGKTKKPRPSSPISADSARELALLDSFPVIAVRDTAGRLSGTMQVGQEQLLCAMSRNRYTGEVRILVAAEAPPETDSLVTERCEVARQLYAQERSG
jgi:hypothetical protein